MTEKIKSINKKPKNTQGKSDFVKLLLTVAAAFVTALVFRRSVGIIAMLPIGFAICALASFIAVKPALKLTIFGISVFFVNTVEQKDIKVTIVFTALCLLACFLFDHSARLIKAKKKQGITRLCVSFALVIGLSILLIGNPISALKAKNTIEDYTEQKYPQSENAALGEFDFTNIYYNFETKAYCIDAVSSKYPTEGGTLSFAGSKLADSFERVMEQKLTQPYILEMTSLLRKYFPDDSFSVSCNDIASLPNENILSAEEKSLNGRLVYVIQLGGIQTANGMSEQVEKYLKIIDDSEIDYCTIVFKSGTGQWLRRSVTVNSGESGLFNKFEIDRVPAGTSEEFNYYLTEMLSID